MAPLSKAEVRQNWHTYISARVGPPPTPPSAEWASWILLQQSLARFGPSFHGALNATYRISPEALTRCVLALEHGHTAVARGANHVGQFLSGS